MDRLSEILFENILAKISIPKTESAITELDEDESIFCEALEGGDASKIIAQHRADSQKHKNMIDHHNKCITHLETSLKGIGGSGGKTHRMLGRMIEQHKKARDLHTTAQNAHHTAAHHLETLQKPDLTPKARENFTHHYKTFSKGAAQSSKAADAKSDALK